MNRTRHRPFGSVAGVLPRGEAAARLTRALIAGTAATLALLLLARAAESARGPAAEHASATRVRDILRSHSFRGLDGRTTSLESLRGQVVVLNVWASWCAPCRKELPELQALHAEIAKKGGRVMAVSIDLEARNAARFAQKLGLTLPVYHDGVDGIARELNLDGVPWTVVLDRGGNVAFSGHGSDAAAIEQLKTVTRRLIAAPVAQASQGE